MATRKELLAHLWSHIINLELREMSLDTIIAECRRHPGRPFSDTGPAIERILAAGVSRSDLTLLLRFTAYEAVFGTLYALSDPGAAEIDDIGTLYEELLMADPSGMEGRPGSADAARKLLNPDEPDR